MWTGVSDHPSPSTSRDRRPSRASHLQLQRDSLLADVEIRTTGALQTRLRATFPELGNAGWAFTTLPFEDGDTLGLVVARVKR